MEYGSIERELHIDASPEVVFEVLTSPEHILEWWSAEADAALVAGTTNTFRWTDQATGRQESAEFTIVELNPPRTFSFRWSNDEGTVAGPGNSLLATFELVPSGDGTTVLFKETGYRERGWEAAKLEEIYNDHRQGWDFYLPRLAESANRYARAR